jgi:uncharacterized delta-60 repeat protein
MTRTRCITLFLSIVVLGGFGASQAHAAAGDLDRTFGGDGKVPRNLGAADAAVDIATQPDRTVLALIGYTARNDQNVAVARFLKNGRIDRRFGNGGVARVSLAGDEYPGGIALQSNGRIAVSFSSDPRSADGAFGVARFRGNGKPDRSLDRDGVQTAAFGTGFSDAFANDVALDGSDIVVAGRVWHGAETDYDFAVARFNPGGALDGGFSGDGLQTTDFNEQSDSAYGVDVDSEGRVVVVGTADPPGSVDPLALARYDTNGELDSSFSEDGRLVSTLAPEGHDVVTLADGRIAVAGTVGGDFLVARFAENGDPDTTFAGDGAQTVDFVDGADRAAALAFRGGKFVVVGEARTPKRGFDFGVARLTWSGSLDRTFSNDGRRAIGIGETEDKAYGVAIDRTGDVVIAGSTERRSDTDTAIVRLQGKGGRR